MSLKIWLPLNGNIENQGTLNTKSRLPSGYTEVEYLESTGAQYIDTGVDNSTNSIKLYTTIQVTVPASVNTYALGYYTDNQGQFFLYRFGTVWQWGWRCDYLNSAGRFDTNKHSHMFYVENGTSYYKLDGQIVSQQTANRNGGRIYIAGNKHGQSTVRTFTAAIDDGTTMKRSFVPCYRNSDNKPGMYDAVTGTFYTNAGSGEFSVGPAVTCSITNNGATVDNNGKIGKCYSFNGSSNYVQLTNSIIEGKKPFTFSVWYKTTSGNSYYPIISVGTSSNGFTIHGSVNRLEGGNGTNHFKSSNHITAVSWGMWAHLAVTYDGTKIQSYLNGVPNANSLSWTYGFGTGNTTIKIGHFWGGYFKGYINDFRLYDECLSAEEIKEISRGMVLHYKMCQPERSENLLSGSNITQTGEGTTTGLSCDFRRIPVGSKFTLSIDIHCKNAVFRRVGFEPSPGGNYLECWLYSSDAGASNFNGRLHKVYTMTSSMSVNYMGQSGIYIQDLTSGTITIGHPKIEIGENPNPQWSPAPSDNPNWGTIEYDGSGYKNHGTVSGNVTLSADSPRYTGSYNLSNGNYITAPGFTYINSGSISFWAKINTIASNGWLPFTGPTKSHYIMASTGGTGSFYHNAAGEGTKTIYEDGKVITAPSSIGVWHHYVITNVDLTTWTKFMINNYEYNWNANMQMSDIRVYSTILDATDVAELYKLGRN